MTRASHPQVMKLSSVKSEVRYSPNMILVKMIGSYTISQVILRISDIKRTKMVRYNRITPVSSISLFYLLSISFIPHFIYLSSPTCLFIALFPIMKGLGVGGAFPLLNHCCPPLENYPVKYHLCKATRDSPPYFTTLRFRRPLKHYLFTILP